MGFGIIEPTGQHHPPGTVKLLQGTQHSIKPVPQATTSPNDPLNWSQSKKFVLLLIVSIGCALAGIEGTFLAVATLPITEELGITITQTESFTSYPFLAIAVGCVLSATLSRTLGKRPVYLASAALGLAATAWNSRASSFSSFMGARIIYGLAAGTAEALPFATVGDMYFVHQRGRAMSFFSFMALGCTQIAPVLGGFLTDTYGWRSQYYVLTAFRGALLILIFLLVPETHFDRSTKSVSQVESGDEYYDKADTGSPLPHDPEAVPSVDGKKRTYIQQLKPYYRIHSGANIWQAAVRYFTVGLYPIIWYAFIPCGTYLAWYLGINVTLAQIFASPPIGFTPTQLGFINTFGLPGALLAEVNLHLFADSSCRWLTRRNNDIYEPEFRLFMMIPAIIVALLAYPLYGWYAGVYALEHEISWVAASVLFGMAVFCLVQAQSVAFAYLLDAHQEISIEAGMFVIMLRSFFTYGATTFVPMWLETSGIADAFYEIAGVQAGIIIVVTSLMFVFGKRVRAFTGWFDPLRRFGVMTGRT